MKKIILFLSALCLSLSSFAQNNCGQLPTEINIMPKSANNMFIVWQQNADDQADYALNFRITNTGNWQQRQAYKANSFIELPLLQDNQRYEYRLERKCPGDSQYSIIRQGELFTGAANGAAACTPPAKATGYVKYDREPYQTAAHLFWQYVNGVPIPHRGSNLEAYKIRYRVIGTPTWLYLNSAYPNKEIRGLVPEKDYEYQVNADCGGGRRSVFSESFFFTTPSLSLHWSQRVLSYKNITINGEQDNAVSVTPGQQVTLSFDWEVASTGKDGYCPGCIIQFYVGMKDQFSECFTSRTFYTPNFSTVNGTKSITFTAPTEPGKYYITTARSLLYYCQPSPDRHQRHPNSAFASIQVEPNVQVSR